MKLATFNLLVKMMLRTTSANDPEALAALRHANRILAEEGADWERVLRRVMQVDGPEVEEAADDGTVAPNRAGEQERIDRVNKMFSELLYVLPRNDFRDFILSLQAQWEERQFLTHGQREALTKAHRKNVTERRR